ncbi:hypothetical protein OOK13_29500 [Streptomyces sp. NBC_00378]|uniref:hypothetical protein n=1 Tax=unclassified Streptomyces TaxID=2593676 RepID=UPI00224FC786|nr:MULTISPECIES: hypothetical protein [unclassified Streptomyces]MCX5112538.1 hypothetical protein [Streptomyces sp. NBC_00378]
MYAFARRYAERCDLVSHRQNRERGPKLNTTRQGMDGHPEPAAAVIRFHDAEEPRQ